MVALHKAMVMTSDDRARTGMIQPCAAGPWPRLAPSCKGPHPQSGLSSGLCGLGLPDGALSVLPMCVKRDSSVLGKARLNNPDEGGMAAGVPPYLSGTPAGPVPPPAG